MFTTRTVAVIAGALIAALSSAQTNTGVVRGLLTDSSGAVIPRATVALIPSEQRAPMTTTTAENGEWSFAGVPAGGFTLKVEFPGFSAFNRTFTVEAGRTADIPIQLLPEASRQEVTVSESPGPELSLDAADNAAAATIAGADLDALPDDPDDLSDMLAQLAGPGAGINGGPQILLDGFSNGQLPAKAAIKEIRVNQNPFSAEYDWLGFGRIEIITKPGADQFRGSAGLTDSDAILNSRNPYADNKADYVNRIVTGNLAGPVTKRSSFNLNFQRNIVNNTALIDAVTLDPSSFADTPLRETVVTPRTDIDSSGRFDTQLNANNTLTGTYRQYLSERDNNGIGQYSLVSRAYSSEVRREETSERDSGPLDQRRQRHQVRLDAKPGRTIREHEPTGYPCCGRVQRRQRRSRRGVESLSAVRTAEQYQRHPQLAYHPVRDADTR